MIKKIGEYDYEKNKTEFVENIEYRELLKQDNDSEY